MLPKLPVGTQKFTGSPFRHRPLCQQVAVGGDVVDDLGQHATPVDGVGAGKEVAPLCQFFPQALVREQRFDAGLSIVKVADHGGDTHVGALLGGHLQLLDEVLSTNHCQLTLTLAIRN